MQCTHAVYAHEAHTHAVYLHVGMVLMGAEKPPVWQQSACHRQALTTRGRGVAVDTRSEHEQVNIQRRAQNNV
jgi:hypothetical protein